MRVNKSNRTGQKKEHVWKARLAYNGLTQRAVAMKLGISRSMVNQVVRGRKSSRAVQRFLDRLPFPEDKTA